MNKFFVAEGQVINLEAVICAKPAKSKATGAVGLIIYLTDDHEVLLVEDFQISRFLQFCVTITLNEANKI